MATPRVYVEAPPVTPLPFGLLSAAMVVDDDTPHWQMGVQYEPEACGLVYDTPGACYPAVDYGSISVSVDNTSLGTLTITGNPAGTYFIDWGEGAIVEDATPNGATHDYTAPGDYTVSITGPDGYTATVEVTVEDAAASGPFDADAVAEKIPEEGVPLVTGDPFAVYHLFTCKAPGSIDRGLDRARAALRLGEQRGVEAHTADQLAADTGGVDITPTPGTPVHPVDGLALLEAYAAANYGGVATIHVPRGIGTVLGTHSAIGRQGIVLETVQGNKVASGGGYSALAGPPASPAADTGEAWMYVTGQVLIRRAAVIEARSQIATNPATNVFTALAERPYVVSWECITAAVLVTTTFEVPA